MLTESQIQTETEKQYAWLYLEPKQKECIRLNTQFCDPYRKQRSFTFVLFGLSTELPELMYMSFLLTNDHIKRDGCKFKEAEFNFENLVFN